MSIIKLENINKYYQMGDNRQQVLHDLSLSVQNGESLAIMGESGSGKSTLMNIIGLLDRPSSGYYCLKQTDVSGLNDNQMAKLRNSTIGFVFQQFFLLPRLTAEQNVALPLTYSNLPSNEVSIRVAQMLEKVGMTHRSHHLPNELSGGQQQRVAIARALVTQPSVILADEPTGALDSKTSAEIMELFLSLNRQQKNTLIIVTHDPHVGNLCERNITLCDGEVVDAI